MGKQRREAIRGQIEQSFIAGLRALGDPRADDDDPFAWPIGDRVRAKEIGSPRQGPARACGRAFSCAMEIDSSGGRRLLVASTARIQPGGKTARVGDAKQSVDRTREVIAGIVQSRGVDDRGVTRATVWYREPWKANVPSGSDFAFVGPPDGRATRPPGGPTV